MSIKTILRRHSLIIGRLKNKKSLSFDELKNYLERKSEEDQLNYNLSKRTFEREIIDIREVYKIDIQYNKRLRGYCIEESDKSNDEGERLLQAYELCNIFGYADNYTGSIFLEQRKSVGIEYVLEVLSAIKNRVIISFVFKDFDSGDEYKKEVKPLAVKESQGRWYLFGIDTQNDSNNIFPLDRVIDIARTRIKFEYQPFDIQEYFKYSFGIRKLKDKLPEMVRLSFTFLQGQYVKSYPLHSTQKIEYESKDEDEVIISLIIYVTDDFMMEILKYGCEVKVLEPSSFAKRMKNELKRAIQYYNDVE